MDAPRTRPSAPPSAAPSVTDPLGQTVLVLQGGGALGAYQAGCYQAMHEAGLEPDWVIGTSIGAINAAIIAGNAPEHRLSRLRALWRDLEYGLPAAATAELPLWGGALSTWMTMMGGLERFFVPNPGALLGPAWPLGAERAGYYETIRLRNTLSKHIDFGLVAAGGTRLTVGAANVRTGAMKYFDTAHETLTLEHIMASGALPPAFPAVRIGDELFWDGGILSNTPIEAVFDDNPRRSGLVFAVQVWNPSGQAPGSIAEVLARQKDVQYASRADTHIARQKQLHRMRHVINELAAMLPEAVRDSPRARELAAYGCRTRMHIVHLLAPPVGANDASKDIDFSAASIRARWEAGYRETASVIARAPWECEVDPLEGFILHEVTPDLAIATT